MATAQRTTRTSARRPAVVAPRRLAIYSRISLTDNDLGVARQEAMCRDRAESEGWPTPRVYRDNNITGTGKKHRPQWAQLAADIEAGLIDCVITYHQDRLTRSVREMIDFIDLFTAHPFRLVTLTGEINLGSSDGQMVATMLAAVAKKSSQDTGRRVADQKASRALTGVAGGGVVPYGWKAGSVWKPGGGLALDPVEAAVLREAVSRVLEKGQGLNMICRDFTLRGIPTRHGKPFWSYPSLKGALTNPRIAGHRAFKGEIVARGDWEPLIDDATYRRLVMTLDRHKRALVGMPRQARRYLLSGIARCICGAPMNGTPKRPPSYRCSAPRGGCGRVSRNVAHLDDHLLTLLASRLEAHPITIDDAASTDADHAEIARLGVIDTTVAECMALVSSGEMKPTEFVTIRRRLDDEAAEIRRTLTKRVKRDALFELSTAGDAEAIYDALTRLPLERQRVVIMQAFSSIVVGPANFANRVPGKLTDPDAVIIEHRA